MTAPKKEWTPNISLDESLKITLNWLIKVRQKNALSIRPPTLYSAYLIDDFSEFNFLHDVNSLFRFSSKDTPEHHNARDIILRLLSVCLKAHHFLAPQENVRHEPYFFTSPDPSNLGRPHYGIIYRLDGRPNQAIIVATYDILLSSSFKSNPIKFPVVLTQNSYKWLDKKHWSELSIQANILTSILKPWQNQQDIDLADQCTQESDFCYGTLLHVPYEIRKYIKPTGIRWSDGLKRWYLPKGWDVDPVQEYIQWVTQEHQVNREELDSLFWRQIQSK